MNAQWKAGIKKRKQLSEKVCAHLRTLGASDETLSAVKEKGWPKLKTLAEHLMGMQFDPEPEKPPFWTSSQTHYFPTHDKIGWVCIEDGSTRTNEEMEDLRKNTYFTKVECPSA